MSMGKKQKNKKDTKGHEGHPAFYNDQLGENPAEGRIAKERDEKKRK